MDSLNKDAVVYVSTHDDLQTVLSCFKVNEVSHVPVMSDKKLVGIISKTDVVEYLYNNHEDLGGQNFSDVLSSIKANQLMVQPLVEASTSDSQISIMEKLLDHEVGSVVVRDEKGKLAGIITHKDMIQYLVKNDDSEPSFTENMAGQLVQWMDKNGILRISKALSDIGI